MYEDMRIFLKDKDQAFLAELEKIQEYSQSEGLQIINKYK